MQCNDSRILLSLLNQKLRDYYQNLDDLIEDLALDKEEIIKKMAEISYFYNNKVNQFISE